MTQQNKLKPVSLELKRKVDAAPVEELNVAELEFDSEQPRTRIEQSKIESLGASLKANGQLQNIIVRLLDGKKIIVCGERRVRACRHIKRKTINGKVLVLTDAEVDELQLVENAQREDMNPIDEAVAYQKYHAKGMPLAEIALRFGKTVDFISGRLLFNRLIPELQEAVINEELSLEVAKEVAVLGADTQRGISDQLFEQVPIKLLQDYDKEEGEDEEEEEYVDFESEDYDENETPFDDESAETVETVESATDAETESVETVAASTPQILYRRKSISLGKVQKLIAEQILVNLKYAPFDQTDARLHPEGLLCDGCPNRSGSNTLFDLGTEDKNICLDAACFQNKGRKLVQITREAHVPAEGESLEAKTITRNFYSNSPYRLPDTLTTSNYRKIAALGEDVPEDKNCPNSEYAVCVDTDSLAKVFLICTNSDCETHYPKYSFSSTTEPKVELTPEQRSKNYQDSRQKGVTGKACELARPDFFAVTSADYNGLRWIFNDEDLRFMMIKRFCELVISENSKDFVFACEQVGIKALRSGHSTSDEERNGAELLTSYWQIENRSLQEDLSKIDEDRLSKLLFVLTFVYKGRDFANNPIEADAEMQELATTLDANYEIIFAEKQVEVAKAKCKPFAEKYFAEMKAGVAESRPNLFTEVAKAKNGAKTPLPVAADSSATNAADAEAVEAENVTDAPDDAQKADAGKGNTVFDQAE